MEDDCRRNGNSRTGSPGVTMHVRATVRGSLLSEVGA
jgi:hypothetical protein